MIRIIKALGLASLAVAATSMALTSFAEASQVHISSVLEKAVLTGQQADENVFHTSAGTVQCSTATFEGTAQSGGQQVTAQELTVTPTYSGCKAFSLTAQVRMNGCKYTITNNNGAGHTTEKTAYVDITGCTSGKQIEVNMAFGGCIATIPEQHNRSHLVLFNQVSNPSDVIVDATVFGITYELHGGLCGHPTTQPTHNGTYLGEVLGQAFVDNGSETVTSHTHQYNKVKDGAQVPLQAT
jgi:hypothetical protein